MNIDRIIADIDSELSTRKTESFGIKVSYDIFRDLAQAGKIKKAKFGALGTGLFEGELPAYCGRFFIYPDLELAADQFEVGADRV